MTASRPTVKDGREKLATVEDVSAYLGLPVKTLHQWRYLRIGPRAVKVGRHLRYRWADVDRWLDAQASEAA